jgi:hypothetical protein
MMAISMNTTAKKAALFMVLMIPLCLPVIGLASAIIYPATPGAAQSTTYEVKINDRVAFVEKMARFDVPIHYARMAYDGMQPLTIDVYVKESISSYTISPRKKNIRASVLHNRLRFSISQPGYLVVKIDSLEYLFLLIDAPETNTPKPGDPDVKNILDYGVDPTGGRMETQTLQRAIDEASENPAKHVLYFPKGEYLTGQLNMKSNVSIYLEPGALIKGSSQPADYQNSLIRFTNVRHVRIFGRGTIDGSGWDGLRKNGAREIYLLFLSGCSDVWIDGPVLRDPCFWNTRVFTSTAIHLRNIKIMNNCPALNWTNTDGVDFDSSSDCDLVNSVMHTGDDNIVVKGLDTTGRYNTKRIRVEKIIGISNSAATKIGTETCVKYFRNIEFKDIDIVRCKRAIVISGFDSSSIDHIRFSGIRVEQVVFQGKESPRIFDIEVTDKSWRECTGRCRISHIKIRDIISFFPISNVESQILGRTPEFNVSNVTISRFRVMGRLIRSLKAGNIRTNEFATGITF